MMQKLENEICIMDESPAGGTIYKDENRSNKWKAWMPDILFGRRVIDQEDQFTSMHYQCMGHGGPTSTLEACN